MARHTEGPYEVQGNGSGGDLEIITRTPLGVVEVATVHGSAEYHSGPLPVADNARLMAAAPDMIEVLRRLDAWNVWADGAMFALGQIRRAANAAIAKAEEG